MATNNSIPKKTRGDHCLNVFVSHDLKQQLKALARKYDRTTADIVRAVLRIGIPMMDGLSQAEEVMVKVSSSNEASMVWSVVTFGNV